MEVTREAKTVEGSMAFGRTRQTNILPERRLKVLRPRRSKPAESLCDISKRCLRAASTD
jgi:hypothetical protein